MKLNTLLDFLVILKTENYKAVGGTEIEWSKLITKITSNARWYATNTSAQIALRKHNLILQIKNKKYV